MAADLGVDEGYVVLVPAHEPSAVSSDIQDFAGDGPLASVANMAIPPGLVRGPARPHHRHPRRVLARLAPQTVQDGHLILGQVS